VSGNVRIAVVGATGTAGSRVLARLRDRNVDVVEVARSRGADLVTGEGLSAALDGVTAVVDASNPRPHADGMSLREAVARAADNLVGACAAREVSHLVLLSISGIDDPALDGFPYYVAKREQEQIVRSSPLRTTVLRTTQWHEFATNPSAVTCTAEDVLVQDWLIQPVAVDAVAEVLAGLALEGSAEPTRIIAGPEVVRLPDLTRRLLERRADPRRVRAVPPVVAALGEGALLAPADATVLGPTVDGWLDTLDRRPPRRTDGGG
jgi:uncharacterized protein YbjT (DUF2867 family)